MASTTSFDDWLDEIDPSYYTDTYALYEAITGETSFGSFEAKRARNGTLIVTSPSGGTDLVLVSKEAEAAFLKLLCGRYVEDGMDIGSWYAMNSANESDN